MRRTVLYTLIASLLLLLAAPAQAHKAVDNSWTQMQNGGYPVNTSDANCSPCVRWPYDYYSGTWHTSLTRSGPYYNDLVAAMKDWSGQQYRSPIFSEGSQTGCPNADVCADFETLDPIYCGHAALANNSAWYITSAIVSLRSGAQFSDGPSSTYCDLRWVWRHEVGHAFSEGHSSKSIALMYAYKGGTEPEKIDVYAQRELSAVYGVYGNNCTNNCPGLIADLKNKLLNDALALDSIPTSAGPLAPPQ